MDFSLPVDKIIEPLQVTEPVSKPTEPEEVTVKESDIKKAFPEPKKEKPVEKPKEEKPVEESASPAERVNVDIKDFPFSYYLNLLRLRVRENWNPPFQSKNDRTNMSVVIRFNVLRNGKIMNISIDSPSGRFLYDQAALRAVTLVGALPPLPDEYMEENLQVHIEFEAKW